MKTQLRTIRLTQPTQPTRLVATVLFAACVCLTISQPRAIALEQTGEQSGAAPLQYTVGFSEANQHRITVDLLVPVEASALNTEGDIELAMAVWTPGSYLVREFARHVETISASDARTGEDLPIRRSSKNRWQVEAGKASLLRVSYRLYCHEMSVRTNLVDADMAILNGTATFLTLASDLESQSSRPHHVEYVLPPNWSDAIAELPSSGERIKKFIAKSFDELVDAPVVLGNPVTESFDVGGVTHRLVCIGDTKLWNIKKSAKDVAAIVAQQHEFWKSVPYQNYTFLNVIAEAGGGLEHDNSCLMMTSRWSFRDPKRYRKWLGLVSHELFHTWNVRRLRPLGLQTYDYETENYTDGLWVAEGVTSYYDDLLQRRADKLAVKPYLERLSESIKKLESKPGANVQSLANSSHDAWIKFYRPDENSRNTTVSYYGKGSLVAWLLDARIRIASDHQKSLDDCMRELYAKHAGPKRSFTLDDLLTIVRDHADQPTADWLRDTVQQPTPLDYQVALDCWGLAFDESDGEEEDAIEDEKEDSGNRDKSPEANQSTQQAQAAPHKDSAERSETSEMPRQLKYLPDLGVQLRFTDKVATIQTVLRGHPASRAGWNVGDELIALDDYRINQPSVWESALKQLPASVPTKAVISRRGRILSTLVTWDAAKPLSWKLEPLKSATEDSSNADEKPSASEQQIQCRKQWLGQKQDSKEHA